jgi:hypothetical protein
MRLLDLFFLITALVFWIELLRWYIPIRLEWRRHIITDKIVGVDIWIQVSRKNYYDNYGFAWASDGQDYIYRKEPK